MGSTQSTWGPNERKLVTTKQHHIYIFWLQKSLGEKTTAKREIFDGLKHGHGEA